MIRRTLRVFLWLLAIAVVIGGYAGYRLVWGTPFTITQLADRQAIFFLLDSPELLTSIGLVDGTMLDFHSGKFSDYGVAERDRNFAVAERNLAELKAFDRASLSLQDQITYDVLQFQYASILDDRKFAWTSSGGLYAISPMWGGQIGVINFMIQGHTIKNRLTAENYVKRVGLIAERLDKVTAEAQRQYKLGVVLPVSLLDKSLAIIKDNVAPKPSEHPLVQTLAEKIDKAKPADIDADLKASLMKQAASSIESTMYPAYARMTAVLESMRPAAEKQSDGVDRLPGGAAYYALALRRNTTTDYTADQIHQLGLDEAARITREMDAILVSQGLAQGTVAERTKQLGEDPKYLYANTDEGRAQILAEYDRLLKEVLAVTPQYFSTIPSTKLEVRRDPPASEKGGSGAHYNAAALDGSRPGVFYANLRDTKETPKWSMKTLAYHEGIPGHHFQIATAQNLKGLPFIRQQTLFTAYAEGWALYAERLAKEMGMYNDDPLGDLGRLQAEIFRAARLVVDTGIHAKGWSREQAIDYMVGVTGMTVTDVTTEVERYMARPGQACAYKVGQLKILELREKARQALGNRFDPKAFHRVVLENGAVPLSVLERLIDDWIASAKS
ncbi:MAG: DUF885 domain-containing protein [Alphaproteobacteria bacterium]|nr:DUF885 domain-containing protein [Alphaproteobacteria bacterium]